MCGEVTKNLPEGDIMVTIMCFCSGKILIPFNFKFNVRLLKELLNQNFDLWNHFLCTGICIIL